MQNLTNLNFTDDIRKINKLSNLNHLKKFIYARFRATNKKKEEILETFKKFNIKNPIEVIESTHNNLGDDFFVDQCQEGLSYSTIEISALADNFNLQIGIYNTIDSSRNDVVIIKATIKKNNEKYKNYWVKKDCKLFYYFQNEYREENHFNRDYKKKTNQLLYYSFIINNPVDVHVFYRYDDGIDYNYSGIYTITSITDDGRAAIYTKRDKISSIEVNEYNKTLKREEKKGMSVVTEIGSLYKEGISKIRLKQGVFREALINIYGQKCMICKVQGKEFVIASHIKPYSKSNFNEATDTNNGLLLCPNHDKLFDLGFISFDNNGKILISNKNKNIHTLLGEYNVFLPYNYKDNKHLKYHREEIFINE